MRSRRQSDNAARSGSVPTRSNVQKGNLRRRVNSAARELPGGAPLVNALAIGAGIVAIALVLFDVFSSIIVPRATGRSLRPSAYFVRFTWPIWRALGLHLPSADRRESFLGVFAPLALVSILVLWVFGLTVGFGLVLLALGAQMSPTLQSFGTALYYAGTSLLTIGYGDTVPVGG